MEAHRFAIYYAPEPAMPWADFCTRWLGWDMEQRRAVALPDVPGLPLTASEATAVPRKYGLHATLKPPFRLAEDQTFAALRGAVRELADGLSPAEIDGLALTRMGRFLALRPVGDTTSVNALAAGCVTGLDRFRAPLTPEEAAKRLKPGMSDAQRAYVARWGYPYVLDQFRFHITLTGRLAKTELPGVEAALGKVLTPLLPEPLQIGAIALVGEGADGRFFLIERFALRA